MASLLVVVFPLLLAGSAAPVKPPPQTGLAAPSTLDVASRFPEGPEKGLVLEQCSVCHGLDWVARSGGDRAGWERRLVRMIRAGATITREQIPALAAYLAKALPERPMPPPQNP